MTKNRVIIVVVVVISILNDIDARKKTFAKFAFKTIDKEDNIYLAPVLNSFSGNDPKGTMSSTDLWFNFLFLVK